MKHNPKKYRDPRFSNEGTGHREKQVSWLMNIAKKNESKCLARPKLPAHCSGEEELPDAKSWRCRRATSLCPLWSASRPQRRAFCAQTGHVALSQKRRSSRR
jgi:hypothetical protein